jgi:hypothetical protein
MGLGLTNRYNMLIAHSELDPLDPPDDPCDTCEDTLWLWTHYRELCDDLLMDTRGV